MKNLKTENGNYLVKCNSNVAYFNSNKDFIRYSFMDEWNWAVGNWDSAINEEIEFVFPIYEKKRIQFETPEIGYNELHEQYEEISQFVIGNWDALYEGAVRLGLNIEDDDYAPERISINGDVREEGRKEIYGQTRLHQSIGLKYAVGHKYDDYETPSERTLIECVKDINMLINAAKKEIKSTIEIVVK